MKRKDKEDLLQRLGISREGVSIEANGDKTYIATDKGKVVVWFPKAEIDGLALRSIQDLTKYPDVNPHIAVMPDFHIGASSVNGSVIPSRNTLYVNAIGGDIGCGIASLELPFTVDGLKNRLQKLYHRIYDAIPTGRGTHSAVEDRVRDLSLFDYESAVVSIAVKKTAMHQFGTLGDGNHFVELQRRDDGILNLMVHTGSRHLGQVMRLVYTNKAKTDGAAHGAIALDASSPDGQEYLKDMEFAIRYAQENRREILERCCEEMTKELGNASATSMDAILENSIDVSHNFIARETYFGEDLYIHRKGAIRVPKGRLGIIPGSMGTSTYIVEGRGCEESFDSASHGAGRKMSRSRALQSIKPKQFEAAMAGIVSRRDRSILDEAPQAYKDIEQVMRYQSELVKRVMRLEPLLSVKG